MSTRITKFEILQIFLLDVSQFQNNKTAPSYLIFMNYHIDVGKNKVHS